MDRIPNWRAAQGEETRLDFGVVGKVLAMRPNSKMESVQLTLAGARGRSRPRSLARPPVKGEENAVCESWNFSGIS